jgi:Protein of unknown function (DUF3293)
MSVPGEDVWAEYARACAWVEVGERRFRFAPDTTTSGSELWPFAPDAIVHVITAFNPRSCRTDQAVNESRQGALEAELRRRADVDLFAADGADRARTRVERSVAVIGLSRDDASQLGLSFDQNAVFEITCDELRILKCDQPDIESTSPYSLVTSPTGRPE